MTSKRPSADIRRAQLLDAADDVFSEHGVTAPLDLVVERAEVGRATLYRQFPDRRALMLALLERSLDNMRLAAEAMAEDDDAFYKLLSRLAERIAVRSEEHTSELQSPCNLVCRLLLEKKKKTTNI